MSIESDSVKLAPELNYHQISSSYPVYFYRNLNVLNGGANTIELLSGGATQPLIFQIPCEVHNPGEASLEGIERVADQGAGRYPWIYVDCFQCLDYLLYRDTGSMYIVEVRNFPFYSNMMTRVNTSKDKIEYADPLSGLQVTNAPLSDVKCKYADGNTMSLAYKEMQQLICGTVGVGGATPADSIVRPFKWKMADLAPDTFFGLKKDFIAPVETYYEFNFIGNRIGWSSDSPTDPTSNVLALIPYTNGTYAVKFTNLVLRIPLQQNADLVKSVKAQMAKGLTIPIPVVKTHISVQASGAPYTYNLPLDRKQHGAKLKRAHYAAYVTTPAAASSHLMFKHSNINGAIISSYETTLDSQKLQRDIIQVSATANDDWLLYRKVLNNTMYFNQANLSQFWMIVDCFDYPATNDNPGGQILTDGYSLEKPIVWTVDVKSGSATAPQNVAVIIGQGSLMIDQNSLVVKN